MERALLQGWLDTAGIPTPVDRFLSGQVRPQRQPDPADRKRLTEWMLAVQRHGYRALFSQWLMLDAERRDAFLAAPTEDVLSAFDALVPNPHELFGAIRQIDRDVFIGWVRQLSGFALAPTYMGKYAPQIDEALTKLGSLGARLIQAGVPLWFRPGFERRTGSSCPLDLDALLAAQNTAPPLWIRVRLGVDVASSLQTDGFTVEGELPSLRIAGERGVFTTEAHRAGLFEVQDLASQVAGARVRCRPGDFVWDACAGAGGKTLQMADEMHERGVIYATDNRDDKLDALRKRARRMGCSIIRTLPFEGTVLPAFGSEVEKHGGFDWVLVDAPCSSSGTWRRNPDARLRNTPADLGPTIRLQRRLLTLAAESVRPGGHLVYLTCSWLYEEDENISEWFTAGNPAYELVSQGFHGCPSEDADTLFGATWVRRPAPAAPTGGGHG